MSPLVRDSTTASLSSVGSKCHVERVVVADIVANEGYWTASGTVWKKRVVEFVIYRSSPMSAI